MLRKNRTIGPASLPFASRSRELGQQLHQRLKRNRHPNSGLCVISLLLAFAKWISGYLFLPVRFISSPLIRSSLHKTDYDLDKYDDGIWRVSHEGITTWNVLFCPSFLSCQITNCSALFIYLVDMISWPTIDDLVITWRSKSSYLCCCPPVKPGLCSFKLCVTWQIRNDRTMNDAWAKKMKWPFVLSSPSLLTIQFTVCTTRCIYIYSRHTQLADWRWFGNCVTK